ncbi:hypothetical protein ACWGS9_29510 [Bradyrhizobium sp. Arg314]
MTVLLSLDLTPAVNAYDERIASAWRISSQEVGEAIRFVRQSVKVIAEADGMLTPTIRLHRPAYVEQCRKRLPWELSLYSDTSAASAKRRPKWKHEGCATPDPPSPGESDDASRLIAGTTNPLK